MGIKERLYEALMTRGLENLQKSIRVGDVQARYKAYGERIIRIEVIDVRSIPVNLRVRDGRISQLDPTLVPDIYIRFAYLEDFLDLIEGHLTIDQMFAYDGCRSVSGKWRKVVWWDGDYMFGSGLLKEVMADYTKELKKVFHSVRFQALRGVGSVSKHVNPVTKHQDIVEHQGIGGTKAGVQ